MIYLTPELTPSALFYHENLSDFARTKLKSALRYRERGDLRKAEQYARDVQASSQKAHENVSRSAALIHLSDIHRALGKLGPALQFAEKSYHILQGQAQRIQRHNEAVAAYNMGLLHHLLGHDRDVSNWYQTALNNLERAREYWGIQRQLTQVETCVRMEKWVQALSDSLAHGDQREGPFIIIPTQLPDGNWGIISTAASKVTGYLLGRDLKIGEKTFHIQSLGSRNIVIQTEGEYQVLEIPESACSKIGAKKGDHVLARRTERQDLNVPYYVLEAATGPIFGRFERDPNHPSRLQFVSVDARVIGQVTDDELRLYYPVALLRPER